MKCPKCNSAPTIWRAMRMTPGSTFRCPRCFGLSKVPSMQMLLICATAGTAAAVVATAFTFHLPDWTLLPSVGLVALFVSWCARRFCELLPSD